jgi:hypothetical protein
MIFAISICPRPVFSTVIGRRCRGAPAMIPPITNNNSINSLPILHLLHLLLLRLNSTALLQPVITSKHAELHHGISRGLCCGHAQPIGQWVHKYAMICLLTSRRPQDNRSQCRPRLPNSPECRFLPNSALSFFCLLRSPVSYSSSLHPFTGDILLFNVQTRARQAIARPQSHIRSTVLGATA